LISFDIDHLGNIETINRTKVILSEAFYKPVTMFISPSGDGLKLVYWTNLARVDSKTGESDFKKAWDLIALSINKTLEENGLDVKVDQAPKNPSSSMFASYDPELWINPDPSIVKIEDLARYSNEIEYKKVDAQTKAIEKQVKYKTKAEVSIKPSLGDFDRLLEGLTSRRKSKALNAIQGYLETPIGLGKRYNAFFKAVSCIAHLGLSKERIIEIMTLLDYDQSRDISAVLQSLYKYGFFNRTATNQPLQALQSSSVYQEHLNTLKKANQTIQINRFVSEASEHIFKSVQDHHVTMVMSPTGSGKTHFCLKDLPKNYTQGRIFFAVPLISLREQVSAYLDHKTSQILRDGEALKQYKRLIILSYEKLASILPQLGKQDLLIIDEIHLFSSTFRSNATSKILNHIKERESKALMLSATGHEVSSVLSEVFSSSFNSLSLEAKEKKPFNLKVIKTASILDSVVSSCIDKLKDKPNAKILVYKDDIADLHEIESKLKDKAISSLILTSSHKDTETFRNIFNGSAIPKESVILATGVVSVGVTLPFIDHIIVAGKVSTASLIQVADRGRRGQDVEMLISTNQRKAKDLVNCFEDTYIKTYLERAQRFVSFENERLKLLYGDDLSPWDIEDYIKATHHTLKTSSAKHASEPLHGILAASKKGQGGIIVNIQGMLSNLGSIEARNEASWDYYFSKLKTLYGIEAQICEAIEAEKEGKKEKVSVWDILKEKIGDEEVTIERVEETIKSMKISERQKDEIIEELQRRLSFLSSSELSPSYALLDAKEWTHFMHMVSINKAPMLHPLEIALAEKVRPQTPLFIEDMRELVGSLDLKGVGAEHLKEAILELNNVGLGKLFRRLFSGRDSKRINPHTGKQARCLLIEMPLWCELKQAKRITDWEAIEEILG